MALDTHNTLGYIREEKCHGFAFEGRESIRVPNALGDIFPDTGQKLRKCRSNEFCS